jgi:hypothetical protein
LVAAVLIKALSSCYAEIMQAWNELLVQECQLPILWGHLNKVEGHFSLGERGF